MNGLEETPLVSILCLAYNHEKYIRQALDGFVSQKTDFCFEVIIHDDASTDATAEIIREYERRYPQIIRPIYQKENQYRKGVNIGDTYLYPKVRGKYIAECEGDDYWVDPCKLQKQIDFLEEHTDYLLVHTRCMFVNAENQEIIPDNNTLLTIEQRVRNGDVFFDLLNYGNFVLTASVVYRRSALVSIYGKIESRFWLDYSLFLLLAARGKFYRFPQIMTAYRRHTSGLSYEVSRNSTLFPRIRIACLKHICTDDKQWIGRQKACDIYQALMGMANVFHRLAFCEQSSLMLWAFRNGLIIAFSKALITTLHRKIRYRICGASSLWRGKGGARELRG